MGQSTRCQRKGRAENIPEGREGERDDGARASNCERGWPRSPTARDKGSAGERARRARKDTGTGHSGALP